MDYKSLTPAELDSIFAGVQFKTKPLHHQLVALAFAMDSRDQAAYWMDIGTGKTLTALYATQMWGCKRILVVCPPSVIRTWEEQIHEHTDRSMVRLEGTRDVRRRLLSESGAEVVLLNYEGLKVVFGDYVPYAKRVKKTGKMRKAHKFIRDQKMIDAYKFDCIIFDEIHHLSHFEGVTHEIAYYLSAQCPRCIGLTGTPLSQDMRELWAQYAVIDLGASLGTSFREFTNDYFGYSEGYGRGGMRFPVFTLRDGAEQEILERVASITLRYDRSECADLPPKVYERRYVTLSPDQWKAMDMLVEGLQGQLSNGTLNIGNVSNMSQKLAQITGGFIYAETGAFRFAVNPKANELLEILKEVKDKVIVYHIFVEEGRIIEDALRKAGIDFRSLRSEIKNKDQQVLDFKNRPDVQVLIAHPKSGGEGQNLQVAPCTVFYSEPYDGSVTRAQCEGRTDRIGQTRSTTFIDLLAEGTIDEHIYDVATGRVKDASRVLAYIRDYRPRS